MKHLLLSLSLLLCLCSCSDNNNQALGTLERDRIVLKATASEIITAIPVKEGTWIKKGDLLIQLDTTQAHNNVNKAQAILNNAIANQIKLRNGARAEDIAANRAQLEGAQAELLQTTHSLKRTASLTKTHMASQADLDGARNAYAAAQASVKHNTQLLLALTNGTRSEDLSIADAQVAEAEASLAIAQHDLDQLSIKATRDGFLDSLPKYLGERVTTNDPVALLLANTAPYARVYIQETIRTQLHIGQQVNVHIDGIKTIFEGTLRWVAHDPAFTPYYGLNARDRALLVYLAEIDLPDSAKELPSGLPVQVDIISPTTSSAGKSQ